MKRFTAAKKLDALDSRLAALKSERRSLEIEALGAEVGDQEHPARYVAVADEALRSRLLELDRTLREIHEKQRAAAVAYWSIVVAETRAKLEDLRSDSPFSAWRRGMWWDVLTVLWIFGGAGWLVGGITGAAIGTAVTALCAWYIVGSRERARLDVIRTGEEVLRSNERELAKVLNPPSVTSTTTAP